MRHFSILLLLSFVGAASASAQSDAYARHWPVQVDEPGVYVVTLTPEIYGQIQRADLGDLAAFNAAGEALAFEPSAPIRQSPEPQWREAHWFVLPAQAGQGDGGLSVQVEKAADGSVSLRADAGGGGGAVGGSKQEAGSDLLIDTGVDEEEDLRLQALSFQFDPAAVDLNARVRIDVSGDLESWRTLAADAALLQLKQGGRLLQRRRIEFSGASGRYLRLHRLDATTPLPLTALQVQVRPRVELAPEPPPAERLSAELVSREGRTFYYRLPARIPVERVNLRPARENTVIVATISVRERERDPWRNCGRLTAFLFRAEGVELESEALWMGGHRDREWRVEVDGDLADAPTLEFTYYPARWVLLTQGEAPYVIAAGSTRATRSEMPLSVLLTSIRSKNGDDWQPPEASLGAPVVAAGEAAIKATAEERWSGRALWLVLIGSALALGMMVVRLLRERPAAE